MQKDEYKELYREYWQHARHSEWQRLTFTASYSIAMGIALGFVSNQGIVSAESIPIMVFFAGLSFAGFLLVHSWAIAFVTYSRLTDIIAQKIWKIPEHLTPKIVRTRFFALDSRHIFSIFYAFLTSAFIMGSYVSIKGNLENLTDDPVFYSIGIVSIIFLLSWYKLKLSKTVKNIENTINETNL